MQNAITITLNPEVLKELASIADGSRRPGSWERSLLERMGLVTDDEHYSYRPHYGPEA